MTITKHVTLEEITCGTCGIEFAVPAEWIANRRAESGDIHCPNGCRRSWRESDADRLRKQLAERERQLSESKCQELRKQQHIDSEIVKRLAAEKKLRRVKNGVCPCCNRSFVNLRNHIKSKHPSFTAPPPKSA